jgi:hypothetical protein
VIRLTTTGYLIAGLVLSLAVNVGFVFSAGYNAAKHAADGKLAEKDTTIARLQGTVRVNSALAERAATDHTALLTDLQAIATRGQETRTVWRTRTVPTFTALPGGCAPGQERQDAVNVLIAHPLGAPAP